MSLQVQEQNLFESHDSNELFWGFHYRETNRNINMQKMFKNIQLKDF